MTNQTTSPWHEERVADLTRLWAEGLSCQKIGDLMGFTRNAIVGKVQRLNLPTPEGKRPTVRKEKTPRIRRTTATQQYTLTRLVPGGNNRLDSARQFATIRTAAFKLRCVEVTPLNLTLADLPANGCHYIPGDDLLYCGHPIKDGSSYCAPHHFLVWEKPRVSQPKARIYQGTDFARGAA